MDDAVGSGYEIRVGDFDLVDSPFAGSDIGSEVKIVIGESLVLVLVLVLVSGRPGLLLGFDSGWDDVEQ